MSTRGRRRGTAPARLVERRIGLLFAVFLVLLGSATMRSAYLFAFKGSKLKSLASTQQVETATIPARRGTILDRNGRELAVSEDAATVYATPYLVKDPVGTAKRLAPLLDQPAAKIATILADRRRGFAYLARKLSA